jgi:hypothetical protein
LMQGTTENIQALRARASLRTGKGRWANDCAL